MNNPHDKFFKRVFQHPHVIAAHLAATLPTEVVALLDLEKIQLDASSSVAEDLTERHTDLLFSVPFREAYVAEQASVPAALMFVMFEHQSTVDPLMPWRVLEYMVQIWSRWRQSNANALRLPPILPLLLVQSKQGWTSSTQFQEIVAIPPEVKASLACHIPRFELKIQELASLRDDEMPGTEAGQLALLLLKHHGGELLRLLRSHRSTLQVLAKQGELGLQLWRSTLEYAVATYGAPDLESLRKVAAPLGHDAKEYVMAQGQTYLERAHDAGVELGVELGVERGVERGTANQTAAVRHELIAHLSERGVVLTDENRAAIDGCDDVSVLMQWLVNATLTGAFDTSVRTPAHK